MQRNGKHERGLSVRPLQSLVRLEETDGEAIAPAVSIHELEDAFLVTADMPGAEKETIEVRAQSGALTLRSSVRRSGHEHRFYLRRFALTDDVDFGSAEAQFTDGVLTVRLPKRTEIQKREIPIKGD